MNSTKKKVIKNDKNDKLNNIKFKLNSLKKEYKNVVKQNVFYNINYLDYYNPL